MAGKIPLAYVSFRGKHRVVFESVAESDGGYVKCAVFAEIHENHRTDNVIRMQFDLYDLWVVLSKARETVKSKQYLIDAQTRYVSAKQTQNGAVRTWLEFAVTKRKEGGQYYINFRQEKQEADASERALSISYDEAEFEAFGRSLAHFAEYTQERFFGVRERFMLQNTPQGGI